MLVRCTMLALLVAIIASSPSSAQGAVGKVGKIVAIGVRNECPGVAPPTLVRAVRIRRGAQEIQLRQGDTGTVFLNDRYVVPREADVRLQIASVPLGEGDVILAPQLMCRPPDIDTTLTAYVYADTGVYQIDASPAGLLRFGIRSGGAFIQWITKERPLLVVAGGHTARVTGTELAITADASGARALLYLREGTIRFPEADTVTAGAGDVFELRQGESPRRVGAPRPTGTRLLEQDIAFHRAAVETAVIPKGRSIWSKPLTYVVLAGVGAVAVCASTETKCGLEKPRRSGTIVMRIPL